jgi:hypothetical protein
MRNYLYFGFGEQGTVKLCFLCFSCTVKEDIQSCILRRRLAWRSLSVRTPVPHAPRSPGPSPGTTTTSGTSPRAAAASARTVERRARAGAARAGVPRRSWPPQRPIGRRSKRAQVVTGIKWVTRPSGSRATVLSVPGPAVATAQPLEAGAARAATPTPTRPPGRAVHPDPARAPQVTPAVPEDPSAPAGLRPTPEKIQPRARRQTWASAPASPHLAAAPRSLPSPAPSPSP